VAAADGATTRALRDRLKGLASLSHVTIELREQDEAGHRHAP